jgi:hypothetical protein
MPYITQLVLLRTRSISSEVRMARERAWPRLDSRTAALTSFVSSMSIDLWAPWTTWTASLHARVSTSVPAASDFTPNAQIALYAALNRNTVPTPTLRSRAILRMPLPLVSAARTAAAFAALTSSIRRRPTLRRSTEILPSFTHHQYLP